MGSLFSKIIIVLSNRFLFKYDESYDGGKQ